MAGLLNKWEKGLARTRKGVFDRISDVFRGKDRVDEILMDELEQILIEGDVGVDMTMSLIEQLKQIQSEGKEGFERKFRDLLKAELRNLVREDTGVIIPTSVEKPHVIFIVGVNGTGKTTTIGKMADRYRREGKKVLLACADTFRAAAGEQLAVWGKRAGVDVVKQAMGADPASVAFDALEAAMARGIDLLIVDTAGRLHTKVNLMEELKKIHRVLKKRMDTAPHEVLLTLDATTGQNGLNQAKLFTEAVGVTGIVLTKLDGTARGGIVVAIRQNLGIPVKWVGVGEGIEDLIPFDAEAFVEGMLG